MHSVDGVLVSLLIWEIRLSGADLVILLLLFLSSALGLSRPMQSPCQEVPGSSPECRAGWGCCQLSGLRHLLQSICSPGASLASNAFHTAPSHLHEWFQNVSFTDEMVFEMMVFESDQYY